MGLVFGVGIYGPGEYSSSDKERRTTPEYRSWAAMLRRCYSDKSKIENPTYSDVTVCDEWLVFQEFAEWRNNNYIDGWHLDKDILMPGNRVYCPLYCRFVPPQVNHQFIHKRSNRGPWPVGVSMDSRRGTFLAKVSTDSKTLNLGSFSSPDAAHAAYLHAKKLEVMRVAEKYKSLIGEEIYSAMLSFPIELELE